MLFDLIGVRLRDDDVGDAEGTVNWSFTDVNEDHVMGLAHRTIHHRPGTTDDNATASIRSTKEDVAAVLRGERSGNDMLDSIEVTGDTGLVRSIFSSLDTFSGMFGIVEP